MLKRDLQALMGVPVDVNIVEIRKPELDAQIIADGIAEQLEKRVQFRRAMKRAHAKRYACWCQRHQNHDFRPSERCGYCP